MIKDNIKVEELEEMFKDNKISNFYDQSSLKIAVSSKSMKSSIKPITPFLQSYKELTDKQVEAIWALHPNIQDDEIIDSL